MSAPVVLTVLATVAAVVLAYHRAANAASVPATGPVRLPDPPQTGVAAIDEIFVTGIPTELDTLARTVWAEARGEGYTGMQAVANVVMNRFKLAQRGAVTWWGKTVRDICLAPNQFSAWRAGDPNRPKALAVTLADRQFQQAHEIAKLAIFGNLPDVTFGATHYHAASIRPSWAVAARRTTAVGAHVFYSDVA